MREARCARPRVRDGAASAFLAALLLAIVTPVAVARDAYVANISSGNVSVINTQTNQVVGSPIKVGTGPDAIAITPDGRAAYVANRASGNLSVINTQTNQVVGSPIAVGAGPDAIAVTPGGKSAYVANATSGNVSVINTQTNQIVGAPISVGKEPAGIAITPDGKTAYVANEDSEDVSVINTQTNQVVGSPIAVGSIPIGIAITPSGATAYVANAGSRNVSVINTQTNQVVGAIKVGTGPDAIAITPDGSTAYVANATSGNVSVINTQTNQVAGSIAVGESPVDIAITPDGRTAYVGETGASDVLPIGTQTGQVGPPIPVGTAPFGIAITPDQPPIASFSVKRARPSVPAVFSAATSSDPDGTIVAYAWSFGDGQMAAGGPGLTHMYGAPGSYQATLTLTDNEGCSTSLVFTGQTAYCSAATTAVTGQTVTVAYPGVRVACPKGAKPAGCEVRLEAVAKKPKGRSRDVNAQSGRAKAKLRAGRSAIVSLKPRPAFASKLAVATKILVEEAVTIKGSTHTTFRKLAVVQ